MAKFELKLPKMGESVAEATVTNWLKAVGDRIEVDEAVLEIATDKVDSEVPSEVEGVLLEILFKADDVVQVGQTLAIIETEAKITSEEDRASTSSEAEVVSTPDILPVSQPEAVVATEVVPPVSESNNERFYSPLVKNIATAEGISHTELDTIPGTGKDGRVTKNDILKYVENRPASSSVSPQFQESISRVQEPSRPVTPVSVNGGDEIIEMTRMGKLIAHHMVESVQTSAHVQSFIEADVTSIWNWRKKVKDAFEKREGESLTFTPIFM